MKDKYKKEKLQKAVINSTSFREVARQLEMCETGRNVYTIKKYIELHTIDTSHFLTKEEHLKIIQKSKRIPNEEVFTENSTYNNSKSLKKRLIEEQILEHKCSCCGNPGVWLGKPITLQLDHINGVHNDNRLFNLRLLCPNCHSQTDTYAGKHLGRKFLKSQQRLLNNGFTDNQIKKHLNSRKVERPTKEVLMLEIETLGYSGAGRKYGVSDNAIRKWLK